MTINNGAMYRLDPVKTPDDETDEQQISSNLETPLTPTAFELSDQEKIRSVTYHFKEIMKVLGLDLDDDSLKGTPSRVAKMYVKEIFSGLDPRNKPQLTLFDNHFHYRQMLVEKNITVHSTCEHHFVPIVGKAHVAYISSGKVIGLSKINRIVQYFSRRPQVQECLTMQIANELKKALETEDVAVMIDATHYCVASRGVGDTNSSTVTVDFGGRFLNTERREEFFKMI